jgi:hypothetical protein
VKAGGLPPWRTWPRSIVCWQTPASMPRSTRSEKHAAPPRTRTPHHKHTHTCLSCGASGKMCACFQFSQEAATSAGFGQLWPTHEWGFALATSPPSLTQASTVLSGSATHPHAMHVQDMVARASADAEQLRGELERMKGSLTREQAMRAEAERQVRCCGASSRTPN